RAAHQFHLALEIQKSILDFAPSSEINLKGMAATYNNLSALFIDSQPETARQWIERALKIQVALVRSYPKKRDYQSDLALNYTNLGRIHARLSNSSAAGECFRDAATIQTRLAKVAPLVVEYRRDLAVTYNNLGMAQSSAAALDEAEVSFKKALVLQQELVS